MTTTAWKAKRVPVFLVASLCLWAGCRHLAAQEAPAEWPLRLTSPPYAIALYEPEVETYEQDWVSARAAASLATTGAPPVFGALWFGLRLTPGNEPNRARVLAFRLDRARFPAGSPVETSALERLLGQALIGRDL